MWKTAVSHGKDFLKLLFSFSFYLKGADPYLILGFQRKNESCQKCCQFFFYEVWQRTFYFLRILWDLEIDLGISPPRVNIIIPVCIEKILFSFQRAFIYIIQLCPFWQPHSVWNRGVSTHVSQMRELRQGWLKVFPRIHGCYEQNWELRRKPHDSLVNWPDHTKMSAGGDPEEARRALLRERWPFLYQQTNKSMGSTLSIKAGENLCTRKVCCAALNFNTLSFHTITLDDISHSIA